MKGKNRTLIFVSFLLAISIINFFSPIKIFSEKENRFLAQFPKLSYKTIVSGEFTNGFETFVTDQFIGRDNWIGIKTLSQLAILKKDNGRVYFGKDDYLFDISNGIDKKQFEENIKNINKFIEKLKEYDGDMDISALLIPSKTEILGEKLPLYAPIVDEKKLVEDIRSKLNSSINIMDLIDDFKIHSNEYIYYRTDHHWTTDGAYYGYKAYMESLGKQPLRKEDFIKEKVSDNFSGTSFRKANLYNISPDDIYMYRSIKDLEYDMLINGQTKSKSIYDESFLKKTDQYSYFLGGDKSIININTNIKNDKTIVVIKDSFFNSLLPFLLNHYENIIILDTRYYNGSLIDVIEENSPDEVLLLYNIQNFTNEKSFYKYGK